MPQHSSALRTAGFSSSLAGLLFGACVVTPPPAAHEDDVDFAAVGTGGSDRDAGPARGGTGFAGVGFAGAVASAGEGGGFVAGAGGAGADGGEGGGATDSVAGDGGASGAGGAPEEPWCGDGARQPGEVCDGDDFGGASCEALGLGPGNLVCAADCSSYESGECGPAPDGAPRIVLFGSDVTSISEGEAVTFSVLATDPDGIDDLVGGALQDPISGSHYGTLVASSGGAFSLTVGWAALHAVRPIEFGLEADGDRERSFQVVVYDAAGHHAAAQTRILLDCGDDAGACDGVCTPLDSVSNCGSCGAACGARASCESSGEGFACACPAGQDFCGGSDCVSLAGPSNCGACGNACSGGTTCTYTASGYRCQCPAGKAPCNGTCVDLTQPSNCGACGNACSSAQKCIPTNIGATSRICFSIYDKTLPQQPIDFSGANYFEFGNLPVPPPGTRALVEVRAGGDFNAGVGKTAALGIEGSQLGTFPAASGSVCGYVVTQGYVVSDIRERILSPIGELYEVTVSFDAASSVRKYTCGGEHVSLRLTYPW